MIKSINSNAKWQYRFAWWPVDVGYHTVWLRRYAKRLIEAKWLDPERRYPYAMWEYSHQDYGEYWRYEYRAGTFPLTLKGSWHTVFYCIEGGKSSGAA